MLPVSLSCANEAIIVNNNTRNGSILCCVAWYPDLFRIQKARCFKQYCTSTQQLLLDWKYNFKHYNFRKQTTMFVREKHVWKRNCVVDPACGFLVKALVVWLIGHTWKTDHIVPWQVSINLKESTYYWIIFGGQKTQSNCRIPCRYCSKFYLRTYF